MIMSLVYLYCLSLTSVNNQAF